MRGKNNAQQAVKKMAEREGRHETLEDIGD
jgi:hypothetical protein